MYTHTYQCIYIYIYTEREREINMYVYIYIYIIHIYIYAYIHTHILIMIIIIIIGQKRPPTPSCCPPLIVRFAIGPLPRGADAASPRATAGPCKPGSFFVPNLDASGAPGAPGSTILHSPKETHEEGAREKPPRPRHPSHREPDPGYARLCRETEPERSHRGALQEACRGARLEIY